MDGDRGEIQALVERGAVLFVRLLDGYVTMAAPVYWLSYETGVLRYCRAGPAVSAGSGS
jgi:hypothetical protein